MHATPLLRIATDDTLARRVSRGDDDAFALLYDRYRLRLEAYCRGILRHDEDAGDAAQSALAAAYQALRRGTQPAAFRPWMFRIAHNEAISVIRRRRAADEVPESFPGRQHGPADALELREELTAVLDAVRALAPGARSALLLRELGDLDYPEVARVLGTTPGGARQAVFEARVALRDDRAGRGTDCAAIRRELSVHDGRRRQSRQIRGHLRGCGACRDWSRAQRQRRQRLALGGVPLPFAGWLAGALGGFAGAGTGASLSGGLALNAQTLAAMAVVAAGAAPVVIDSGDGAPAQRGADAAAAAAPAGDTATRAATAPLGSARGSGILATASLRDPQAPVFRAVSATSNSDADDAEPRPRRAEDAPRSEAREPEAERRAGDRPRFASAGPPPREAREWGDGSDEPRGGRRRERGHDGGPDGSPPRDHQQEQRGPGPGPGHERRPAAGPEDHDEPAPRPEEPPTAQAAPLPEQDAPPAEEPSQAVVHELQPDAAEPAAGE